VRSTTSSSTNEPQENENTTLAKTNDANLNEASGSKPKDFWEKVLGTLDKREEFLDSVRKGLEEHKAVLGSDYEILRDWVSCLRIEGLEDVLDSSSELRLVCKEVSVPVNDLNDISLSVELLLYRNELASKLSNKGNSVFALSRVLKNVIEELSNVGRDIGMSKGTIDEIAVALAKRSLAEKLTATAASLKKTVIRVFKHVKNFAYRNADLGLHCWNGRRYEECEGLIKSWLERAYTVLRLWDYGLRYTILEKEVISQVENETRTLLNEDVNVIAFNNCAFNWETLTCEAHNPEKFVFINIPHEVDIELLNQLLQSSNGVTEDIMRERALKTLNAFKAWVGDKWIQLLEIIGFVLYARPYKKAVLLIDREGASGDTGKSTYIRYLQNVVGKENYCSIPLQVLTDPHQKFTASIIYRKLANFYADLPEKALEDVGQLKVLTGEDTITIEFKYGNPFTWLPYTKHVFSANVPPVVRKYDAAFWGRWLVIEFLGNFKVKVREFEKTLEDEIPQAIALGIAAFVNVLRRGRFSYENTAEDAKIIWMSRSDTVYAFMEWAKAGGALFETPSGRTPIDNLYPYYVSYCELSDKEALEQKDFTSRLKNLGYTVKRPKNVPILLGYDMNAEKMEALIKKSKEEE